MNKNLLKVLKTVKTIQKQGAFVVVLSNREIRIAFDLTGFATLFNRDILFLFKENLGINKGNYELNYLISCIESDQDPIHDNSYHFDNVDFYTYEDRIQIKLNDLSFMNLIKFKDPYREFLNYGIIRNEKLYTCDGFIANIQDVEYKQKCGNMNNDLIIDNSIFYIMKNLKTNDLIIARHDYDLSLYRCYLENDFVNVAIRYKADVNYPSLDRIIDFNQNIVTLQENEIDFISNLLETSKKSLKNLFLDFAGNKIILTDKSKKEIASITYNTTLGLKKRFNALWLATLFNNAKKNKVKSVNIYIDNNKNASIFDFDKNKTVVMCMTI